MQTNWSYVGPDHGQATYPKNIDEFKRLYTGNTGNLLYYYATRCCINFTDKKFGFGSSAELINKHGNGLVFSLANQLGAHTDLGKRGMRLDQVDVPLVGLGLGAQIKKETNDLSFIPEGTVNWIRELTQHSISNSPNLTVRGDYTFSILEKLGLADKALPIGCQTNFINSNRNLGQSISERLSSTGIELISIAAGSPANRNLRKLEASLLRLAEETQGRYIVQHPLDMINLAINYSKEEFNESFAKMSTAFMSEGFSESEFRKLVKENFKIFVDPCQWMLEHQRSDAVVGTRIHGIQSALQAGVPAICLYIDSRTKELCEKMKIPSADANEYAHGITKADVIRILSEWNYEEYDSNRIQLVKKFHNFLLNNKITPSNNLSSLAS